MRYLLNGGVALAEFTGLGHLTNYLCRKKWEMPPPSRICRGLGKSRGTVPTDLNLALDLAPFVRWLLLPIMPRTLPVSCPALVH